jgi:hypothetical protein
VMMIEYEGELLTLEEARQRGILRESERCGRCGARLITVAIGAGGKSHKGCAHLDKFGSH